MEDRAESTPIFDALWEKYNGSPIYDRLVKEYEDKKHEELVEPYQPSIKARVFSYEEYLALFNKEQEMAKDFQDMVNEFRQAMDLPVPDGPRQLTTEEQELHIQLIRDEFEKELVPAILANDLVGIYDGGIDVMYYLIGLLSNAGMQIRPGFEEVHRSNMSKMDPVTGLAIKAGMDDPDGHPFGKVLKGPNYFEPRLGIILNNQSQLGHEETAVYKDVVVPLRLGFGGPKIGEGTIHMDNMGDIMFEGVMDDVSVLPVINHLGFDVTSVSINETEEPANFVESQESIDARTSRSYETGFEGGPILFPGESDQSHELKGPAIDLSGDVAAPYDR